MLVSKISGMNFKSAPSLGTPLNKPKVVIRPFDLFCSIQDRIVQDVGMPERSIVEVTDEERLIFKLINARCWDVIKRLAKPDRHENIVYDSSRSDIVMFELLTKKGTPYVQVGTTKDGIPHSIAGYYNEEDKGMTTLRFDEKGRVIDHPASKVFLKRSIIEKTRRYRRPTRWERSVHFVFPSPLRPPQDMKK